MERLFFGRCAPSLDLVWQADCEQRIPYTQKGEGDDTMQFGTSAMIDTHMDSSLTVCGKTYRLIRLLGHGKGGYSYLAECEDRLVVLKQIHHEPCDYYTFGNKIEAERNDYERLRKAGIRVPCMIAVDVGAERIVKEYIDGETVFDIIRAGLPVEPYLDQVRLMAAQAKVCGLNIDYFPTNFVVRDGLIWYIDYECNQYMDEWNFENWGIKYWSRTPEFLEYAESHSEQ